MSPFKMSKIESTVRVAIEFNAALNQHDVVAIMQLVSDDCIFESFSPAPEGTSYAGREALTQYWRDFFRSFPEAQIEIEDIFGLGKRCVMCWVYRWVDARRQACSVRGVDILRVQDGLIQEQLSYVKG